MSSFLCSIYIIDLQVVASVATVIVVLWHLLIVLFGVLAKGVVG